MIFLSFRNWTHCSPQRCDRQRMFHRLSKPPQHLPIKYIMLFNSGPSLVIVAVVLVLLLRYIYLQLKVHTENPVLQSAWKCSVNAHLAKLQHINCIDLQGILKTMIFFLDFESLLIELQMIGHTLEAVINCVENSFVESVNVEPHNTNSVHLVVFSCKICICYLKS